MNARQAAKPVMVPLGLALALASGGGIGFKVSDFAKADAAASVTVERTERLASEKIVNDRIARLEKHREDDSQTMTEVRRRTERTEVLVVLMQEDVKWLVEEARRRKK